METHERVRVLIIKLPFDGFLVHILGNGVVDIEKSNDVSGNAGTDEFGKRTINIHFARNGDTLTRQTTVDVARHETEHGLESGPALACYGDVLSITLVRFYPVQKR